MTHPGVGYSQVEDLMLVAEEAVEILHHSIIVSINGESFRLKDKRKAGIFAPTKNARIDVTKKQAVAEQYDSSPQLWLPRRR